MAVSPETSVVAATHAPERASWVERMCGRLEEVLRPLSDQGVRLERRGAAGTVIVLAGRPRRGGGQAQVRCRQELARLLADFIVESCEEELLRHIVRRHYAYLAEAHREAIVDGARRLLAAAGGGVLGPSRPARKARVEAQLLEHLGEHDALHLEGFVRFRLKDYVEQLEDAVDRAADDFFMEREHGEYILLLRHFVDLQEPRLEAVHVVAAAQGYRLYDPDGTAIDRALYADVVVETGEREGDDALIGALVSLAPQRVLLHDPEGRMAPETVETLRRVFERRVHSCRGCRICEPEP